MTIRYVGPGGSDGNSGLTWALRKLTLNGVEDTPVAPGDTVYVGPGTYREELNCDIDGTSGNPITYIGDVTGENTDGIGGIVRITGSDNDQTPTRPYCVDNQTYEEYRVFRGFLMDTTTVNLINDIGNNWTVEDCVFSNSDGGNAQIETDIITPTNITIQRNVLLNGAMGIDFVYTGGTTASNVVIQNNLLCGGYYGIHCNEVGAIVIRNNTFRGWYAAVYSNGTIGTACTVYNNIFTGNRLGIQAGTSGDFTEDYNAFLSNNADLSNVTPGSNSVSWSGYPDVEMILLNGYQFPQPLLGEQASFSQLQGKVGSSIPSDDLYGISRPATAGKKSWGAVQAQPSEREGTDTYDSSPAAVKLSDASSFFKFVPVDGSQITITCRVKREANYAGTNPQMIIHQPGQSDDVTTDVGSSGAWNLLTTTFTPASSPGWVLIELRSNNTATSGSYAVRFDAIE